MFEQLEQFQAELLEIQNEYNMSDNEFQYLCTLITENIPSIKDSIEIIEIIKRSVEIYNTEETILPALNKTRPMLAKEAVKSAIKSLQDENKSIRL
ncbi:MAG: hypothetical protein IJA94_05120 [Bacilli bacterium]|nr:hypothetical protein [Bacilli bacterium]